MTEPETIDVLRRVVLAEPDGYSTAVHGLLRALGFNVSWAKVRGNRLTAFVGGTGNGPVPDIGERLVAGFGGHVAAQWAPGDSWWVWNWEAEVR
jgi:hypothetical protein